MKKYNKVILLNIVLLCSFCNQNNDPSLLLLSPEKDKVIHFSIGKDNPRNTKISIAENSKSSKNKIAVFSIDSRRNEIESYWLSNEIIVIEFPSEKKITLQKEEIPISGEVIKIRYNPFKYAKITSHETEPLNGGTSKISVEVSKEYYNKKLMLVNEKQERISLPGVTGNDYEYSGNAIAPGNYRLLLHDLQENRYTEYFEILESKNNILKLE